MGNGGHENHGSMKVQVPATKPFLESLTSSLKETFFPDDPFNQFKNQSASRKFVLFLQYFVPILEWAPRYTFDLFKADFIAGITIASLAVPQGISYAGLASLPPVIGLYSSFVPPFVYAMLGSSKDLAVGTVAVPSLLITSMLGKEVSPHQDTKLYVQLVLTATFFAGVFQAALGFLRLGFIVDFLSHATIVGFMGGAATVVCLQQLKGILGLVHFTHKADLVSAMKSIFTQMHMWRWESVVLGCGFLFFLLITKYYSRKKPVFFWANALAPLVSVIFGSILVYLTHADRHGIEIIGHLKKGLNPPSIMELESTFKSAHLSIAIKTGLITGLIALAEGIAVGRSFAVFKNYHIDGNKEMIAIGMMNIAGSCTSCYLTTGPFSRTAVNFNAGCKTAVSNIVMATAVMITLLFLTPLFHYTPLVVLSAIIMTAMISIIDYSAAVHLWTVDKFDFVVCISAYIGVVFGSVETGIVVAVALSLLRVLLFVARPRTSAMGSLPNSVAYRNIEQYKNASPIPGILILHIDAPIYFANANYLRERILRWINEEEEKLKESTNNDLQYIILDMTAVGSIDTSGISMLEEINRIVEKRCMKLVLANPGAEVMKKLDKSNFLGAIGNEWIHLTVGEAVNACKFTMVQTSGPKTKAAIEIEATDDHV
ncbi:sulfate transporter 3.1-like [Andrographis paniculata]|uniref:sulfate transporter 3.1-like n=1 Tax=Andrographis paniculata TaxID=175694 RepID=UPI0021E968F5|nr:sulfate transporter 3.1-like [Andrographis paniculata]